MASITIKDIPTDLHQRLKTRAKAHRRSLNAEVIACLESILLPQPQDVEAEIEAAKALRESINVYLTQKEIDKAIEDGRRH
jgi:plasmid stability protein